MTQHPIPHRPEKLEWAAAVLSYLVPGLGQVYRGRSGNGILFFVSLYVLFFYGMSMGKWKNVYLPTTNVKNSWIMSVIPWKPLGDVENRPHFAGQFWIGVAAWPAVIQYATYVKEPNEDDPKAQVKGHAILGTFQREPSEGILNDLQRNGDKRWDLGWVYTVVAGVLNILVIYDALAGPAFRDPKEVVSSAEQEHATPVAS
jgi:hypothetical protein